MRSQFADVLQNLIGIRVEKMIVPKRNVFIWTWEMIRNTERCPVTALSWWDSSQRRSTGNGVFATRFCRQVFHIVVLTINTLWLMWYIKTMYSWSCSTRTIILNCSSASLKTNAIIAMANQIIRFFERLSLIWQRQTSLSKATPVTTRLIKTNFTITGSEETITV